MHKTTLANHSDEEITFAEIWGVIVRYKFLVFAFPVAGILAALIVTVALKPQWEASGLIRIGKTGLGLQLVEPKSQMIEPKFQMVEPISNALERIRQDEFKEAVLKQLAITSNLDDAAKLLFLGKMKAELGPAVDLIKITTRGYSREQALQFADTTLTILARSHSAIISSGLKRLDDRANLLKKGIAAAELEKEGFKKSLAKATSSHMSFMDIIVISNFIHQRDVELRELRESLSGIEDQLDLLNTNQTAFLEAAHASSEPVFPNRLLIIFSGGIFGLLGGLFAAFFKHAVGATVRPLAPNGK
jgi:uncharacterized protein involved in exopolysaccharide biosynthesis